MIARKHSHVLRVPVYALRQQFVELPELRVIGEEGGLGGNDVFVVAHGGTRLGIVGRQRVDFARRLVDERDHHVERQMMGGKDLGGNVVAVVDEVASPHS